MDVSITHYTKDISTIGKILRNGLAWVPNKRKLISSFIGEHDFTDREPQEFGMISFTELEPNHAAMHRKKYGQFGIVMSPAWVKENKLQKVIYVEKHGPVHEALSTLFNFGYSDLKSKTKDSGDKGLEMAYTNKAMASVAGSSLWASLLQLYEYLEPIANSYQQEWRMVQKHPLYCYKETKEEIIKNVSPPVGFASIINVHKVYPENISGFICPKDEESNLIKMLPNGYKNHLIETFKA